MRPHSGRGSCRQWGQRGRVIRSGTTVRRIMSAIEDISMSDTSRKVIISCAITGATHVPSMSEFLPITPEQIRDQAIEAAQAGAAIIHLHARDPVDGRPTPSPEIFKAFVPAIAEAADAV